MAELKTRPNAASVNDFLSHIKNPTQQNDAKTLLRIMEELTEAPAVMWGDSIVGFGSQQVVYKSGRTLDWMITGFSPRKQSLTLYFMDGFARRAALLQKLGKAKTGASCLYIKSLADVDLSILKEMIRQSVADIKAKN